MFKITDNPDANRMVAAQFKRAATIAELTLTPFDPETIPAPTFTPATTTEVSEAAMKAALAGKDPSTDPKVQQLLTSHLLGQTIGGFYHRNQVTITRAELEYYREQAPRLLEEIRGRFAQAVTTMKEHMPTIGQVFPGELIRDLDHMNDRKASAVTAAYAANSQATKLVEALRTIAEAVTPLETGGRHAHLIYVNYSHEQYNEHGLDGLSTNNAHGRKHNVWDLLSDGLTIELATTSEEIKHRINRLDNERNNRNRDYKAEAAAQLLANAQAKSFAS